MLQFDPTVIGVHDNPNELHYNTRIDVQNDSQGKLRTKSAFMARNYTYNDKLFIIHFWVFLLTCRNCIHKNCVILHLDYWMIVK